MASQFTEAEKNEFMTMGQKLAEKPTLDLMISHIKQHNDAGAIVQCVKTINNYRKYPACAHLSIEFDEIKKGYKMIVTLAVVPNTYRLGVEIPQDYYNDFVSQANLLFTSANAMWKQLMQTDTIRYAASKYLKTQTLTYDAESQTMYIDPTDNQRISVVAYYVDDKGNVLKKQSQN